MTHADDRSEHQVALVFDLNKCMGCQSCSVACKRLWTREEGEAHQWWCTVNTQPGLGAPRDWEQMGGGYRDGQLVLGRAPTPDEFGGGWRFNHEQALFASPAGSSVLEPENAAAPGQRWGPNWDEDQGGGEFPNAYFFYLPRICNHCSRPACVEACPSGALYKRAQDGVVLRDEERCEGTQSCMRACPYKKIYFNASRGVSQHCNLCFPRLERGVAPACARNCPGRLVFTGYIDDPEDAVHRLVHVWKVALPLHPEFGTEPNVFYVPPLSPLRLREDGSLDNVERIPAAYLESLFGPEVHDALDRLRDERARVQAGGHSELLDTLIAYDWKSLFGPFAEEPARVDAADTSAAVNDGAEVH